MICVGPRDHNNPVVGLVHETLDILNPPFSLRCADIHQTHGRKKKGPLETRGYRLRPRYHPTWTPSWIGTNRDSDQTYCEDGLLRPQIHHRFQQPHVIGKHPRLPQSPGKVPERDNKEIEIARFLTTIHRPDNHSVSLLDVFPNH
ncbi:hypothetical protein C8Q74DRAFT_587494 [Fomes fomentarius]|nr:hypothetical protein C8Q74DRAFT_587494 [Fomes fomentarius]